MMSKTNLYHLSAYQAPLRAALCGVVDNDGSLIWEGALQAVYVWNQNPCPECIRILKVKNALMTDG